MPNLGAPELIIIALVILLLFGATRLPKLGKSMGQSIAGSSRDSTTTRTTDDDVIDVKRDTTATTGQGRAKAS